MIKPEELLEMKRKENEGKRKATGEYLNDLLYGRSLVDIPDEELIKIANEYDLTIIDPATQRELYGDLFDLYEKRVVYTDALNELLRISNDPDFKIISHFKYRKYVFNKIKVVENVYYKSRDEHCIYADWRGGMQLAPNGHLLLYASTIISVGTVDLTDAKWWCIHVQYNEK